MYDWLIVGAGFTGAVLAERIATCLNQRVLLVDRRSHVGGNAHDQLDSHGVLIHQYGPHLFHTNSDWVWTYLSQFTEWHPYSHKVMAEVQGLLVPLPFNLNSLALLFPPRKSVKLQELLVNRYGYGAKTSILKMREETTGELRELADFVYEYVFLGYTMKQWGLRPDQLSPSVTGRVPIVISHDNRYFHDRYQAMPMQGYTSMFERMLDHPKIEVQLNTDYRDVAGSVQYGRMVYSGPIDAFFDYAHGALAYRSLRFEHLHDSQDLVQPVGQINHPGRHAYTRTVEFKHFTGQSVGGSTIATEYSQVHQPGKNEPFYPIPRDEYRERYAHYRQDADKLAGAVLFAGRLADYQYYNMDQVVARALSVYEQEISGEKQSLRRGGDMQSQPVAA